MKITYNKNLKQLARQLRNNSTRSEIRLWKCLKGKQMMGYDFHRQKPINRFIVDFFCNKLKLAIELDGYSHDFEDVFEKDKVKEGKLTELGIAVLRFDDREVIGDIDNVLRTIEGFIEEFEKTHPRPLFLEGRRRKVGPSFRGEKKKGGALFLEGSNTHLEGGRTHTKNRKQ